MSLLDSFDLLETSNGVENPTKSKTKKVNAKSSNNKNKRKNSPKTTKDDFEESDNDSSDDSDCETRSSSVISTSVSDSSENEVKTKNKKKTPSPPNSKKPKSKQTLLKPIENADPPKKKAPPKNSAPNSIIKSAELMKLRLKNNKILTEKCDFIKAIKLVTCEIIRDIINGIFPKDTIYNYQTRSVFVNMLEVQKRATLSVQQKSRSLYDPNGQIFGIQLMYEILDTVIDEINNTEYLPYFITFDNCSKEEIENFLTEEDVSTKYEQLKEEVQKEHPRIFNMNKSTENENVNLLSDFFWLTLHERYSYTKKNDVYDEED